MHELRVTSTPHPWMNFLPTTFPPENGAVGGNIQKSNYGARPQCQLVCESGIIGILVVRPEFLGGGEGWLAWYIEPMTPKQFFDWQTAGGTDDVMRMIDALERADISWCAIGGVAVNHWALEPMVTRNVDFVVVAEDVDRCVRFLEEAGFKPEVFPWSINFKGRSSVSLQLSTEDFYQDFPSRSVAADVHGILMRVASLEDTLKGKIEAWSAPERRQSKRIKDLADIARMVEAHPGLWHSLSTELREQIEAPPE